MRLVLLGPPGAGKGTMATLLSERTGIAHISTGNLLRNAVRRKTPIGQEAQRYMEQGLLVPDDLVIRLVVERLRQPDAQAGFMLDGFPRTLAQAEALDQALAREGRPIDLVVDFETSDETIVRRLAGRLVCSVCQAIYHRENMPPKREGVCDRCGGQVEQRRDDRPETIQERLEVYRRQTEPLVQSYRTRHLLVSANGNLESKEGIVELTEILRVRGLVGAG